MLLSGTPRVRIAPGTPIPRKLCVFGGFLFLKLLLSNCATSFYAMHTIMPAQNSQVIVVIVFFCFNTKGFAQFWSNNVKVFSYIWYLIIESISSCRNHKHRLCDFFKQSLISWR